MSRATLDSLNEYTETVRDDYVNFIILHNGKSARKQLSSFFDVGINSNFDNHIYFYF